MSFRVIGFCGFAGAGKDLAAQALIAHGYVRVSLADPVREALLALDPIVCVVPDGLKHWQKWWFRFVPDWLLGLDRQKFIRLSQVVAEHGWNAAKQLPEVRRLLQRMGTEAGRDIHGEGCWVDIADDAIRFSRRSGKCGVVVTDVRFTNEAELLAEWKHRLERFEAAGSAFLLHIDRPGNGPANDHQSESLEQVFAMADAKIVNDGTVEELHAKVLEACGLEAVPA